MQEGPPGLHLARLFQAAVRPAGGRAGTWASCRCAGRSDLDLVDARSDRGRGFG